MKSIDKFVLVLVASLALLLAGCGGGSSSNEMDDMDMDMSADQMAALMSANTALDAAVTALAGEATPEEIATAEGAVAKLDAAIVAATDVSDTSMYKDAVTKANNSITAAKNALADAASKKMKMEAEEEAKEMAALGKALHAALGGTATEDTTALDNATTVSLTAAGLAVDAAVGAGALPDTGDGSDPISVTLKAGASAGSMSGWAGTDYAHSMGTGAAKVTNEARVYTNKGPGKSVPFADAADDDNTYTIIADSDNKGMVAVNTGNTGKVMAAAFEHSGTQNHPIPDNNVALKVRGTFDGAPGEFSCTGTCTSTNNGSGAPSELGGTWHFKPDTGAMVSQPDANYLYYGWWVRKDSDGPTAASAFARMFGMVETVNLTQSATTPLTGSATYSGSAAGKFAMSNALDGTGSGGHFTADAMLTAKFGAIEMEDEDNDKGVTGTIDNFRLNDASEDPGWSVALNRSSGWGATGEITGPASDATVWSVNGNKAPASGAWSGMMYDEAPGNAPDGDGSNIPTTATGTFYSAFSNVGRMVGAFAVEKED